MEEKSLIQVLGTAQDGGYPQITCKCKNCRRARENSDLIRLESCLGLIDTRDKKTFMVDATPSLPRQLEDLNDKACEIGLDKVKPDGILVTHAHLGHYTGLMYLGKEALNTDNLKVYCTRSMGKFLSDNAPWSDLIENNNIRLVEFDVEEEFKISENLSIRALSVPHRNEHADTVGFIIRGREKSAFYLPDFDYWKDFKGKFNQITKEVDYIFLDGTFFDKNELMELRGRDFSKVPHPPIRESISLFEGNNIRKNNAKIYFTHFNHTNRLLASDDKYRKIVKSSDFNILNEKDCFYI